MIRRDRVHGGNLSDSVLDFSASINPLGPPRAALEAYHGRSLTLQVTRQPIRSIWRRHWLDG
jgi:hypothetical protein